MFALLCASTTALTRGRIVHRSNVVCSAAPEELPVTYATSDNGLKLLDMERSSSSSGGCSREKIAAPGEVVKIRFSGVLLSGATRRVGVGVAEQPWQVDERTETFVIGGGRSPMWEEAVVGMREGDSRIVLVPPSARVRPTKKGRELQVPEGDTIRFECELCAIETGAMAFSVRSGLLGVGSVAAPLAFILLTNLCCYLFYGWSIADPRVWIGGPPQPAHAAEVVVSLSSFSSSSRCAPTRLLESRAQLDLAVQASSVQAWTEAVEVAEDPLLDTTRLRAQLDACSDVQADKNDIIQRVEAMRAQLRVLVMCPAAALVLLLAPMRSAGLERGSCCLRAAIACQLFSFPDTSFPPSFDFRQGERGSAANEEAMKAMNDGTSARAFLDEFLRSRGVDADGEATPTSGAEEEVASKRGASR